ncbi:transmembrane protein, putative [Medicago truncatula]|uniref:Transmembrane protein, putative n=1 Tax=Medicago truncatula TaxID=3880 RepID=G7L2I0_MEDTR|nr:transmembrane protein, putative [Medicago truncatula]
MWKGGVDAACCGWGRGAEVGLSHLWFFFFLTLKHCYYVRLFEKCCLCCLMKCTKVTVGDILSVPFSVFLHTFNDFFLHYTITTPHGALFSSGARFIRNSYKDACRDSLFHIPKQRLLCSIIFFFQFSSFYNLTPLPLLPAKHSSSKVIYYKALVFLIWVTLHQSKLGFIYHKMKCFFFKEKCKRAQELHNQIN